VGVSTSQNPNQKGIYALPWLLCDEKANCFYWISSNIKVTVFHSDVFSPSVSSSIVKEELMQHLK
jgi:hypothetical protein